MRIRVKQRNSSIDGIGKWSLLIPAVKVLGVFFGPDRQGDKKWDELANRVVALTQK